MRRELVVVALLTAAELCLAQTPPASPAFEVASIKPCAPGTPEPRGQSMGMFRFTFPGGRLEARATTVLFLLEWAYGILPFQHSRGPGWAENERFDIFAKAAGNATDEEMRLMTRTLLAERFHLQLHRETRETPVLVIGLGKNPPKLFPPKDGEVRSFRAMPQADPNGKFMAYHFVATRYSFTDLNQTFARQLDSVIVNDTGLDGDFDFTLDFTIDQTVPNPLEPERLIAALRDQLGLTVKPQKAPVDYLVIDQVEKPVE